MKAAKNRVINATNKANQPLRNGAASGLTALSLIIDSKARPLFGSDRQMALLLSHPIDIIMEFVAAFKALKKLRARNKAHALAGEELEEIPRTLTLGSLLAQAVLGTRGQTAARPGELFLTLSKFKVQSSSGGFQ